MRRLRLAALVPLLVLALAFRCVDQSQETIGSATLSFGATNRLVAQTFIVGVTGQLTSISVDVFGASCSMNGNAGEASLIVTTTSGGLPTTTQLISGLILPPATDPGVLTKQNFLTQVAVTKGDVLAIEVRSDAAPCFVRLGPNGNSYLSGNAYTFNETSSTWSCLCSGPLTTPYDWAFATWVDTP